MKSSSSSKADPEPLPPVRSEDLLRGRQVLVIRHGSEEYRLRLTRSGKLILTK